MHFMYKTIDYEHNVTGHAGVVVYHDIIFIITEIVIHGKVGIK